MQTGKSQDLILWIKKLIISLVRSLQPNITTLTLWYSKTHQIVLKIGLQNIQVTILFIAYILMLMSLIAVFVNCIFHRDILYLTMVFWPFHLSSFWAIRVHWELVSHELHHSYNITFAFWYWENATKRVFTAAGTSGILNNKTAFSFSFTFSTLSRVGKFSFTVKMSELWHFY